MRRSVAVSGGRVPNNHQRHYIAREGEVRQRYQAQRNGEPKIKEKSVIAVGFDEDGERLCEITMTKAEWVDMDRGFILRLLSSMVTEKVAYYQWRYVE